MPNNSKGKLTYSPEGSRASHLARQENEKARMITDTSGQICLESYRKSSQHGLLLKMFTESLVGMKGWYSNRCILTWKLRDMKYKHLYFPLAVSVLRTEDTESGLLPTPLREPDSKKNLILSASGKRRVAKNGKTFCLNLADMAYLGMLPTPTARDWKGARTPEKLQEVGRGKSNSLPDYVVVAIGETGKLNPRFVGEMMGFPVNWTEFPFRNGGGKV